MTTQTTTSLDTQNSASLVLQNQNVNNALTSSQTGAVTTSIDPLKAAWSKMISDLKVDYGTFAVPATQELNEGAAAIAKIANSDFQVFATALSKDIKTQVDSLMVTLTKEANEDLKPQLQIFGSKIEDNLKATSQRALTDIWNEALPIIIDTAKISLATLGSGQGFTPAALATIAVQVMQSPHMQALTAELGKELKAGADVAIKDAQNTWAAMEPTINGEIKTALIGFGASVAATTTIQTAVFSANLAKDIAVEVSELHNEYAAINNKNLTTMAKDLLVDASKVTVEVSKKVATGVKTLASKIKGWFR